MRNGDADADKGGLCPIPIADYPAVTMAHGGGGRLSQTLIQRMFVKAFDNPALDQLGDGASLTIDGARLAFSTDSFVVSPLFFPGGDIGSLAVHGVINDLAMCGARPVALSAAMILEEGLPMADLWRIVQSMRDAARTSGASIVTGDTKVVDRGKADGAFLTVSGVGRIPAGVCVGPDRIRPGDALLLNGPIAAHGVAIMALREGLRFETTLESDTAALDDLVAAMLAAGGDAVRALRDPTRGGVASALNELAQSSGVGVRIEETRVAVDGPVRGACEILGLDPLYVANEGKVLAFVAPDRAEAVLSAMRAHPLGAQARLIGEAVAEHPGTVVLRSAIGGRRIVDLMSGEQLPRIC